MAGTNSRILKNSGEKVFFNNIGKELTLKFNLNALYFLEQEYGDIEIALDQVQNGKIKAMISITTAALSAGSNRQEPYSEEEVADMVDVDDLERIAAALEKLLGNNKKKDEATPSK